MKCGQTFHFCFFCRTATAKNQLNESVCIYKAVLKKGGKQNMNSIKIGNMYFNSAETAHFENSNWKSYVTG